jgi:regulator of sigma D
MRDVMERWKKELERLLDGGFSQSKEVEYEFKRIKSIVQAPSNEDLAKELYKYVQEGKIKVFYRVISRATGSGILEEASMSDIPREIYDRTSDQMLLVDPIKDMEIVYKSERAS